MCLSLLILQTSGFNLLSKQDLPDFPMLEIKSFDEIWNCKKPILPSSWSLFLLISLYYEAILFYNFFSQKVTQPLKEGRKEGLVIWFEQEFRNFFHCAHKTVYPEASATKWGACPRGSPLPHLFRPLLHHPPQPGLASRSQYERGSALPLSLRLLWYSLCPGSHL